MSKCQESGLPRRGKEPTCQCEPEFNSRVRESPGEGNSSPVQYLPEKSTWTEELVGYNPWESERN